MILEALRMVADALEHSSEGVNAELASLPRDSADSRPPDIEAVLEETSSDHAARRESGPDWPVLLVTSDVPADSDGIESQTTADADAVQISVRYVSADPDSAETRRHTLYTLRAVVKAIRNLQDRDADRTRNSVTLLQLVRFTWGETRQDLGGGTATGGVVVECHLRDESP